MSRLTQYVPADKRALILPGVPADNTYRFSVLAYRRVHKDVAASGAIMSSTALSSPYQPVVTPAFDGDITGTIQGRPSLDVVVNLENIASDAVLSTTEKPGLILSYNQIISQWAALDAKAAQLGGFDAERAAAKAARDALVDLLSNLTPAWNDTAVHTPINPATFQAAWASIYVEVADLQAAISGKSGEKAPLLLTQYSVNGTSGWHSTWAAGDLFQRTSNDGGQTWSAAIRFVGENGNPGAPGAPGAGAWGHVKTAGIVYEGEGSFFVPGSGAVAERLYSSESFVGGAIVSAVVGNHPFTEMIFGLHGASAAPTFPNGNSWWVAIGAGFHLQSSTAIPVNTLASGVALQGATFPIADGDRLWIKYENGRLFWMKNDTVLQSGPTSANHDLRALAYWGTTSIRLRQMTFQSVAKAGPTLTIKAPQTFFKMVDGVLSPANQSFTLEALADGTSTAVTWKIFKDEVLSYTSPSPAATLVINQATLGTATNMRIEASLGAATDNLNLIRKDEVSAEKYQVIAYNVQAAKDASGAILNMAQDHRFSVDEKRKVIVPLWNQIKRNRDAYRGEAVTRGVSTTALDTAYENLRYFMEQHSTLLILSHATAADSWNGGDYRSYTDAYFNAEAQLVAAMNNKASQTSTWIGVSGAGKPSDNATADIVLTVFGGATIEGNKVIGGSNVDGGSGATSNTRNGPCIAEAVTAWTNGQYINLVDAAGNRWVAACGMDGTFRAVYVPAGGSAVVDYTGSANVQNELVTVAQDETNVFITRGGQRVHTFTQKPTRGTSWHAMFALGSAAPRHMTHCAFRAGNNAHWSDIGGGGKPRDFAGMGYMSRTGTPLVWDFNGSAEGWHNLSNIAVTVNADTLFCDVVGGDPYLGSPGLNNLGSTIPKIRARVKAVSPNQPWEGVIYYANGLHYWSGSHAKSAKQPVGWSSGDWCVAEWDMTQLDIPANSADWLNNNVTQIRFDLVPSGDFHIDWIAMGDFTESMPIRGVEDGADVTANSQIMLAPPDTMEFAADHLGNVPASSFPRTSTAPLVTRGTASIRTADTTTYAASFNGCTGSINNVAGSSDKGRVTITGVTSNNAFVDIGIVVNGKSQPSVRMQVTKLLAPAPQSSPVSGGSGTGPASNSDTVDSVTSTSPVVVAGPFTVRAGAGGKIVCTLNADYARTSQQTGSTTLYGRFQINGTDVGGTVTGSAATTQNESYSDGGYTLPTFDDPNIQQTPGNLTINQTATGLTPGNDYSIQLVAYASNSAGVYVNGSAIGTGQ
jgi:hypothetical protein